MLAFERSLPDQLEEHIMVLLIGFQANPILEWHGYENSWDEVNIKRLQSVS